MTSDEKKMLNRINEYADKVLNHIDPQKTQVSYQLEKLKPIMEELAKEQNSTIEDIFIKYLDLASESSMETQRKFQNTVGNMTNYGDVNYVD